MNKSRFEAFTDAVIAIILTIMILEFKVPESFNFSAIIEQVPYLISYAIGYLFIGTAWYNHHYMFAKTKRITKKVFWANNLWMFATSFLPVATAWVGRGLNEQGPEIFYCLIYLFWTVAYMYLSHSLIVSNIQTGRQQQADDIKRMPIYRYMTNWKIALSQAVITILVLIYMPALQIAIVTFQIIFVGARFNDDSDKLYE